MELSQAINAVLQNRDLTEEEMQTLVDYLSETFKP